jgi:hypothetical protein
MTDPGADEFVAPVRRRWIFGVAAILLVYTVVIVATWRDYGTTWDEKVQAQYGELVLEYFKSGGQDKRCNSFLDLKYYGPLFEVGCAALYSGAPSAKIDLRHFCIAICALITVLAAALYARAFGGTAAIFAALALVLLPRFYGHGFSNSKDIPFACLFACSMLAVSHAVRARYPLWRHVAACGAAIGLTLAIRVGGVIMFGIIGPVVMYVIAAKRRISDMAVPEPGPAESPTSGAVLRWVTLAITTLFLVWLLAIIVWPWAHQSPLLNPLRAIKMAASFHQPYQVLFEGVLVSSDQLPWYYLIKYIGITTPLILLPLALLGVACSVRSQCRDWTSSEAVAATQLQLWLAVPLLLFIFKRPNVYDGLRHFLFVLPALAIFVGLGVEWLLSLNNSARVRGIAGVICALCCLTTVLPMSRLHPYQSSYFNKLAGSETWRRYDTDYWVSSYKEAMEWVNRVPAEQTVVLVGGNDNAVYCAESYADDHVRVIPVNEVGIREKLPSPIANERVFYIGHIRYNFADNFPGSPVVHTVGRGTEVYTRIRSSQP